jgi:hypothetical protein
MGAAAGLLSRPLPRLAAVAVAIGLLASMGGILLHRADVVLASLDAAFLYFAGLAAGSVALAAAIRISYGRWAKPMLPIALAGAGFFGPAMALLVVLLAGAHAFLPWTAQASTGGLAWLWVRLLLPSAVLFGAGRRFASLARQPGLGDGPVRVAAVVYVIAYVVALSFWAYDLVMRLLQGPPFTVIPAFYFVGAFLSGLAWVALVAAAQDVSGPDLRHDVGKLLFGFIVVWSYLLWSLYLPTWYGNIPAESAPLLLRWRGGYKPVAQAMLVGVFFWPFWLLFSERMKRRRGTLAFGSVTVLVGLMAQPFLLVFPSLNLPGSPLAFGLGAGVAMGVAGLFLLGVAPGPTPSAPQQE